MHPYGANTPTLSLQCSDISGCTFAAPKICHIFTHLAPNTKKQVLQQNQFGKLHPYSAAVIYWCAYLQHQMQKQVVQQNHFSKLHPYSAAEIYWCAYLHICSTFTPLAPN